MDLFSIIIVVLGLGLFEIIISVDNAIINAEVLGTMSKKARKWFLIWGILIAVFLVRGLLPWLIIWANNPSLGAIGALTASFSNDPSVKDTIEKSAPILLMGGGTFLIFLFFHWIFLEEKHYGLIGEKFFHRQGIWFFAVVSVVLAVFVFVANKANPNMAFGAVIGSTAFFITHGFKENAERAEQQMIKGASKMSDMSKILYLEVIDATFSIDGVLGAFAFTFSIPLILVGNGIGALVVRQLTVSNIENVKKYKYLKNGAMYSILALGCIMVLHAFGHYVRESRHPLLYFISHIPDWLSPVVTFLIIGYFFWKSYKEVKKQ
ncbi:DUF475 domain-containing protein [Candidatus Woesearchaeota archaeon]|nr:DUF475 domain-containing protein [Candidatus Woesearchaeota archaeon]